MIVLVMADEDDDGGLSLEMDRNRERRYSLEIMERFLFVLIKRQAGDRDRDR